MANNLPMTTTQVRFLQKLFKDSALSLESVSFCELFGEDYVVENEEDYVEAFHELRSLVDSVLEA